MSRRAPEVRRAARAARAADPSLLRKVICGVCGDETGEVALDPVGICGGCATVMKHSSLDGEAPAPGRQAIDYEIDYEDEEDLEDL